jgi:hypothetical protein
MVSHSKDLDDGLKIKGRLAEAADLNQVEAPQRVGGDVPDDPRNYSNPKLDGCSGAVGSTPTGRRFPR